MRTWFTGRPFPHEMTVWGYVLFYALLPLGLTLLALHELSFPFFYILCSLILLDVFFHGLERVTVRVVSGIAALAIYLTFRIQDHSLTTTDIWHFSFVALGSIGMMILVDRRFRAGRILALDLAQARKEAGESRSLSDLSLEIAAADGKASALELAVERAQRLFAGDPVLLSVCSDTASEAEVWLCDGQQTQSFHPYGTNPREMEQRALSLLGQPGPAPAPARALVSVPLLSRERVIGNLAVVKGTSQTSPEEYERLKRLAAAIAVGVENALLRAEARNRAEIEARHILAQEVHDGVAQNLSYLGLKARLAKEKISLGQPTDDDWEEMCASLAELQRDIRRFIGDLRLPITVGAAMMESLNSFLADFSHRQNLAVDVVASEGLDLSRLPLNARVQLIRVLQEALTNVAKHSLAHKVRVSLQPTATEIQLRVDDDGRGFDPREGRDDQRFGLQIMRERVETVGGQFVIVSQSGAGTRLTATFPVGGVGR